MKLLGGNAKVADSWQKAKMKEVAKKKTEALNMLTVVGEERHPMPQIDNPRPSPAPESSPDRCYIHAVHEFT